MKIRDSFRRAGRSLRNAKARTLLTSLAIAVGAFTLTMSIAAGTGARQYADKLIKSNVDPQSIYITKEKMNDSSATMGPGGLKEYREDALQYGGMTYKTLNEEDINKVRSIAGVERVLPTYFISAKYVSFEKIAGKKFTADVTTYDPTVLAQVASGTLPPLGQQIGTDEIVMPESFAEKLGIASKDMVGTTITLRLSKVANNPSEAEIQSLMLSGRFDEIEKRLTPETKDVPLKIRAVSAKSSTSFSASSALFISDKKADELSEFLTKGTEQYKKYVSATVTAKKDVDPATVKTDIEKRDMFAMTAKDLQGLIFNIVNLLQGIVAGFGVLALIASVFGIINTQYISVLERTREIGLMKALGMRGRHVRRLFQYEAAWIGLLGGVIGALLAWGIGALINPWLSSIMSIGENRILVFELLPIAGLIVALMVVAMLAGWFPARKAAKLDPIEALRTE